MADWNTPTTTTLYTSVLTNLKDRDFDAISLCYSLPTNLQTGMMRYVRASDKFQEYITSTWVDKVLSIAGGGTGASTASGARTAFGIGTMGAQNSNSVSITGGSMSGVNLSASDVTSGTLALSRGGTGASLTIGSEGQALGVVSGALGFMSITNEITGTVKVFAGGTIPTGYLLCDGSAVSRSTYSALFTAIGTTYGAGNGSTTFNLPDLRDKVIYGVSATVTLGTAVGAATHTHTGPSHTHSIGSHTHTTPAHSHAAGTLSGSSHTHTIADHIHYGPSHNHGIGDHTHTLTTSGPSGIVYVNNDNASVGVSTDTHTHTATTSGASGSFATGYDGTGATTSSGSGNTGSGGSGSISGSTANDGSGTTGSASGNTGAGGTGNTGSGSTLQPGVAMNFIIKV